MLKEYECKMAQGWKKIIRRKFKYAILMKVKFKLLVLNYKCVISLQTLNLVY